MGSKRDFAVNALSQWLKKKSMKVKISLGILLAFCALVALNFTIRDPRYFFRASATIHIVGLITLIYKLFTHKTCSGKFLASLILFIFFSLNNVTTSLRMLFLYF